MRVLVDGCSCRSHLQQRGRSPPCGFGAMLKKKMSVPKAIGQVAARAASAVASLRKSFSIEPEDDMEEKLTDYSVNVHTPSGELISVQITHEISWPAGQHCLRWGDIEFRESVDGELFTLRASSMNLYHYPLVVYAGLSDVDEDPLEGAELEMLERIICTLSIQEKSFMAKTE